MVGVAGLRRSIFVFIFSASLMAFVSACQKTGDSAGDTAPEVQSQREKPTYNQQLCDAERLHFRKKLLDQYLFEDLKSVLTSITDNLSVDDLEILRLAYEALDNSPLHTSEWSRAVDLIRIEIEEAMRRSGVAANERLAPTLDRTVGVEVHRREQIPVLMARFMFRQPRIYFSAETASLVEARLWLIPGMNHFRIEMSVHEADQAEPSHFDSFHYFVSSRMPQYCLNQLSFLDVVQFNTLPVKLSNEGI